MASFSPYQSLRQFQLTISDIYAVPDDRLFSLDDLLSHQARFTMRALKGIRKNNADKLTSNLLIAFSWSMAVANRVHINIEDVTWHRFPMLCSYCGQKPCICQKEKFKTRQKIIKKTTSRPNRLADFQSMFAGIYPSDQRTLADAGVHLAEEMGEVSEAFHIYLGEHKRKQFIEITNEMADWVSCMFGVANSADINVAKQLSTMFQDNCHICHKTPCSCSFSFVSEFRS